MGQNLQWSGPGTQDCLPREGSGGSRAQAGSGESVGNDTAQVWVGHIYKSGHPSPSTQNWEEPHSSQSLQEARVAPKSGSLEIREPARHCPSSVEVHEGGEPTQKLPVVFMERTFRGTESRARDQEQTGKRQGEAGEQEQT